MGALLVELREQHLRIVAGVPDGVEVDLSLVRLSADALVFPSPVGTDLTALRHPDPVSRHFRAHAAKLGFETKFKVLRASHATILLDKGTPIHVVAARCGHDPVVLMRHYAKRTKQRPGRRECHRRDHQGRALRRENERSTPAE